MAKKRRRPKANDSRFELVLPSELLEQVQREAVKEDRSAAYWIRTAIKEKIDRLSAK